MLENSWYILFIILIAILFWGINQTFDNKNVPVKTKRKYFGLFIGLGLAWFIYLHQIIKSELILDFSLPPKLPILIIAPLFVFTGIFLFLKRNSTILHSIPTHLPIAYQSFRIIIELLFYATFIAGIFPVEVTFEGSNYDIMIGLSAPFIAIFAHKKIISKKVLVFWNITGILVVGNAAFTFITSFYFPQVWGQNEAMISNEFVKFPYLLLPTFFMPSAVFMHMLSLVQLSKKSD